jgi:hypothetical protein
MTLHTLMLVLAGIKPSADHQHKVACFKVTTRLMSTIVFFGSASVSVMKLRALSSNAIYLGYIRS